MRDTADRNFWQRRTEELDRIDCSWCGAMVPLPAEDESGVCIECGAVSFRGDPGRVKPVGFADCMNDLPAPA